MILNLNWDGNTIMRRVKLGEFSFSSITAWGVTVSKASGGNISTYGVGYTKTFGVKGLSMGKLLFGATKGVAFYWALPINRNARQLYAIVKSKV